MWCCRPVGELKLRLFSDSEGELEYQTQVVVFPHTTTKGAEWLVLPQHKALFLRQPDIPGHTAAVVMGKSHVKLLASDKYLFADMNCLILRCTALS